MVQLRVRNPVAPSIQTKITPAPRVTDLAGKRIGLYWNMKAGGDVALQRVEELLGKKYPTARFTHYLGDIGAMTRRMTKGFVDTVAAESDAVVGTTADCGSCTSWLIHDMVEFEKRGVPTVAMVGRGFESDARRSSEGFGIAELSFVVAKSTFTSHSPEEIRSMVDDLAGGIEARLTGRDQSALPAGTQIVKFPDAFLEFTGGDGLQALEETNERFVSYGWSDGFPLYAPTEDRVAAMLQGTKRPPESVVAYLEPGFGIATVEHIAINAVMAGCKPEHMPVLIAAIECISDPQINLRIKAMSTGTQAPMIVVNGPIRERIGLNSGGCALGPGGPSRVNTVIGRALRLCMMNIGHTYPNITDMDTIGSPTKYSMCLAENEEQSPWAPYHIDQGFSEGSSTVTVHFNYGYSELHDFESHRPEDLINVFASAAMNRATNPTGFWLTGRRADPRHETEEQEHNFVIICPEHAEIFGREGWSRSDVQTALFNEARVSFGSLMRTKVPKSFNAAHPELSWLWGSPETLLPVVEDEKCFDVIVVGAKAGRGQLFWGCGGPVTKVIDEP
jgi:hypothetical protein